MHGGTVTHKLTTRPNLDHLRGQAKKLIAALRAGDPDARRAFAQHLPAARGLPAAKLQAAGFRLADAQSVIARENGFESWRHLSRHIEILRSLEGEWKFETLQVDGADVPAAMVGASTLLLDGDLFRMASPEANYDGRFTIDAGTKPMRIDIEFVEGPEAGHQSYGIFAVDGASLTICLGLVGATRPAAFETRPGSGHALERLRRTSPARPVGVTGGVAAARESAQPGAAPQATIDAGDFARCDGPIYKRLEGTWLPVRLVNAGEEMRADWLSFGTRTATGNEVTVVFGGQVMLHVRTRIDESVTPIAVDYLHLRGAGAGGVSKGIMQWIGDEAVFLMAAPGQERPTDFASFHAPGMTLSQWRRS